MRTAVIVDAARSPLGSRHGAVSGWHPGDLCAEVLDGLVRRSRLDPALVEEVVVSCATPMGDQGLNLGRNAVLAAGWPEAVPATTVDRQGAGGLHAVAMAGAAVGAGMHDVVVAAGVEATTTTPPGAWLTRGSRGFGPGLVRRYAEAGGLVPPGVAADRLAERYHLSRAELDRHAAESHLRAARARRLGHFADEIIPLAAKRLDRERRLVVDAGVSIRADECIDEAATLERLTGCKPSFEPAGRVTAGNSAPAADGAAALLVTSEPAARAMGREPLARIVGVAGGGVDPRTMLTAVVPATTTVLRRTELALGDLAWVEVDEPFAAVPLAWSAEHGVDRALVNPHGGAISLGHPAGAAGARALTTLLHGLRRRGGGYGLVTAGGIGGVATAMIVEAAS